MNVTFLDFEYSEPARCLWQKGQRLKLTGQPLALLTLLLEEPGRVVTRDEIRARLWPDTQVDFEHGLNVALNRLRAVLGDNGRSPAVIETVPRVGYRFMVPVVAVEAAATRSRSRSLLVRAAVYALVALAAAAVALGIVHRHYGQIIQRATAGQR
jgi:DNA-binding winged helix-turn-helix (wHTH) protein